MRRRFGRHESLETRIVLDGDPSGLEVTPSFDQGATEETAFVEPAEQWDAHPSSSPPILHSLPGANAKVFLDFDGNLEPSWGGNVNVLTPAFDLDGNPEEFSTEEKRRIHEAWARVSEQGRSIWSLTTCV